MSVNSFPINPEDECENIFTKFMLGSFKNGNEPPDFIRVYEEMVFSHRADYVSLKNNSEVCRLVLN